MTGEATPVDQAHGREGAPGELELVRAFCNSVDIEAGREELTDARALARWLRRHGLIGARDRVGDEELARALALREALRDVLAAHSGLAVDERSLRIVNAASAAAPVAVVIDPDCASELRPAARGFDGAIARLFAIIARADAEGTWRRLKACTADDCRWVFYDHSRNRSSSWCDMAVCGNRAKARAFRERRAPARPAGAPAARTRDAPPR